MQDFKLERLRVEGNEAFKKGNFDDSIERYTEALAIDNNLPVILSNRAQCFLNKKLYFQAEQDCSEALKLDSTSVKSYYRRALARKNLYRYPGAMSDLREVLRLDSENKRAKIEISLISDEMSKNIKHPVYHKPKPEQLRDKKELVSLIVSNLPIKGAETIARLPDKMPRNYIQFDCCWRDILGKNSNDIKFQLLANLAGDLSAIFQSKSIEPEFLEEIIQICREYLTKPGSEKEKVEHIFKIIQSSPSFNLSMILLNRQDREFFGEITNVVS